jgi:chemotaxis protein methyltransferase CheR
LNTVLSSASLELFQAAIAEKLGLRFDDSKLSFLAEVLSARLASRRLAVAAYLDALGDGREIDGELSALARELTVGETYFFRHSEQFDALRELVLPERSRARQEQRTLRLLSVGCASGEEPYTLAILTRPLLLEPGWTVSIRGLDLNPDALNKARAGLYSPWALRETPPDARARWFTPEERNYRLVPELRQAVELHEHNLVRRSAQLLPPEFYDVIFCRNVLMYFTAEHAARIVERLTRALAPGGYLFLGHAETLRGLSHAFHLRHTHNTFYYQRKDALDQAQAVGSVMHGAAPHAPAPAAHEWADAWLTTVARSSERIRELTDTRPSVGSPEPATAASSVLKRGDLREPLALLQNERFSDALAALAGATTANGDDPVALLLRAALLTHQGDLDPAAAACRELLELDELNAGAHYLLALCCERRDDSAAATEHARTAVYLDAGFAMPHLHLGLMARRRRDYETARRELGQALWLLEREDPARLLLFGGGFTRDALLTVCRSELENLRGTT